MARKIIVTRFSRPHYLAGCYSCDFAAGRNTDETPEPGDVRNAVRTHVRQTGHECWIEESTHYRYELVDANEVLEDHKKRLGKSITIDEAAARR